MKIQRNIELKNYNTLKLPELTSYLTIVKDKSDLDELKMNDNFRNLDKFVLGEGSNTLFSKKYEGLIIKNEIKGRELIEDNDKEVIIKLGGGEIWRDAVKWAVDNNWGGIENLALIPGTVGASPVQNIGAYGQSLVDSFEKLDFVHFETGKVISMNKQDCEFGYRDSVFKHKLKGKGMIIAVYLRLSKIHKLATDYYSMWAKYESIEKELSQNGSPPYSIADVYNAVVNIRTRQLPDWNVVPTAGSFFKNPIISKQKLIELQNKIPELQYYPADQLSYAQSNDQTFERDEFVKVPAGRLLDHLGWKGKQIDNCMTYATHAMVVTHNGKANGKELIEYVKLMQDDVLSKFGIDLEMEVVVV